MTKKLTWEADKTSLVLRIADGDRKTEWVLRKSTPIEKLRGFLGEMMLELTSAMIDKLIETDPDTFSRPAKPMLEMVRTVDAEELAELRASSEAASRAAQAAHVAQLNKGAKWFDSDDEESAFVAALPDYDSGEIK